MGDAPTYAAVRATVEVDAENAVFLDIRENGLGDLVVVGGHLRMKLVDVLRHCSDWVCDR